MCALDETQAWVYDEDRVGSRRCGQVLFQAISGDHPGAAIPHLHAFIGSGEFVVELLANGDVRRSEAHGVPIRGTLTAREQRIILEEARHNHELLLKLWESSQPK